VRYLLECVVLLETLWKIFHKVKTGFHGRPRPALPFLTVSWNGMFWDISLKKSCSIATALVWE
jgi:hypothetical protein